MTDALANLNQQSPAEARAAFLRCCASTRWANDMLARRPFADAAELHNAADSAWTRTTPDDWREAFAHHPRIGAKKLDDARFTSTKSWSTHEQSGIAAAAQQTLDRLAALNDAYYDKFGHVFLICATGKSAAEMLAALESRLNNHPEAELAIAAEELRKITHIRLDKLLQT